MKKFIITMVFALVAVLNINGQNISKNDSILNAMEMRLDSIVSKPIEHKVDMTKFGATNEKDAVKKYKKHIRKEKERRRSSKLWMQKYGIYLNNPSEINPYEYHFN